MLASSLKTFYLFIYFFPTCLIRFCWKSDKMYQCQVIETEVNRPLMWVFMLIFLGVGLSLTLMFAVALGVRDFKFSTSNVLSPSPSLLLSFSPPDFRLAFVLLLSLNLQSLLAICNPLFLQWSPFVWWDVCGWGWEAFFNLLIKFPSFIVSISLSYNVQKYF